MTLMMDTPVQTAPSTLHEKERFRRWLNGLWTTRDLMRLFNRGELTIQLWVRDKNLPTVKIEGDRRNVVRYDRDEVMEWARGNGKRIFLSGENPGIATGE